MSSQQIIMTEENKSERLLNCSILLLPFVLSTNTQGPFIINKMGSVHETS